MTTWFAMARAAAFAVVLSIIPVHAAHASRVLATADGLQLTTAMSEAAVAFCEFLAGATFTEAEAQRITDHLIQDFLNDPQGEIDGYRQVQTLLGQVAAQDTEAERAEMRTRFSTQIYWELEVEDEPWLEVVYGYAPVLAADPQSRLIVTQRAVDAVVASNNFVAELAGFAPMTPEETARFVGQLPAEFPEMPAERQALAANAEVRWAVLRARWEGLSEAEREQTIQAVREAVESRDMVPSAARELEQIARLQHVSAAMSEATRDFLNQGAMMILPSIMLQQNATFN